MKTRGVLGCLIVLVGALLVGGCGGDPDPTPPQLEVSPAMLTLANGRSAAVTATIDGVAVRPGQVTWHSMPESVVNVAEAADGTATITAKAQGQAIVTASQGDRVANLSVTVEAPAIDALAITPATPILAAGTEVPLLATATLSDRTTRDVSNQARWSSDDTGKVTVDAAGRLRGVRKGTARVTATLGALSAAASTTVTDAILTSITVTPANVNLPKGLTQQLIATATFSDATAQDVTTQVTWASSAIAQATVSGEGLVTGRAAGAATISASLGAVRGQVTLNVIAAVLQSLAVTPVAPSLAKGLTLSLTATGTYSDATTADLSATATWRSSDVAIATSNGRVVTTVAVGNATISAKMDGVTGTAALAVTAAALVSLHVTPLDVALANGLTQQLVATGTFTDGSTQNLTTSASWASSRSDRVTVSDAAATRGLVTAVGLGPSTVSASIGAISGSATITVTAAEIAAIAVTPLTFTLAAGRAQQLVATATLTDASVQDVTEQATWSSSAPASATVSNTAGERGLVRALAAGTATLTATFSGVRGSSTATVTPAALVSIAVTPPTAALVAGATLQYTATGTYSDASTQVLTGQVTWASSDGNVAQISNGTGSNGLVTGRASGTATISATLANVNGIASLDVSSGTPRRIRLMAANITSGNLQSYDPGHGTRIFQGLRPDVVMIQEFNYRPSNTDADIRRWVDTTFGTNYSFFRETGKNIPNGVISRYPILAAGIWEDVEAPDREFVWARLDIPGAKDLWAISVHLLTRNAPTRDGEARALRELINANVPAADYLVIGGDFNTDSRAEACISTLGSVVSTSAPYPADQTGTEGTNASRSKPYDWVLMDADLRALQTAVVIGTSSFAGGLVFDVLVPGP
jgi:uncharacterized protein YjdB/endonuclease/exonuclease/phosphatase family metal-dependent hydrolase